MSKKFLGKLVAGAALGGASLLVATPGIALADGPHHPDGHENGGYHSDDARHSGGDRSSERGRIYTLPRWAQPGQDLTIVQVCPDRQRHAWVWSEITGKIELRPKYHRKATGETMNSAGTGGAARPIADPEASVTTQTETDPEESYDTDTDGAQHAPEDEMADPAVEPNDAEAEQDPSYHDEHGWDGDDAGEPDNGWNGDDAEGPDNGWNNDNAEEPDNGKDGDDLNGGKDGDHDGGDHHGRPGAERKFVYWAEVNIPDNAQGYYKLKGSCGKGHLVVVPNGAVEGGDGGAGTDSSLAATGAGMLGAAALGGIVLLRRRSDATPA